MTAAQIGEWLVAIIVAAIMSSGFWVWVGNKSKTQDAKLKILMERRDNELQLLLGLAHDRILWLGFHYIEKGQITRDEFENLNKYLYSPYKEMGGNGTAERVMNEVNKLPIVETRHEKAMRDGT